MVESDVEILEKAVEIVALYESIYGGYLGLDDVLEFNLYTAALMIVERNTVNLN